MHPKIRQGDTKVIIDTFRDRKVVKFEKLQLDTFFGSSHLEYLQPWVLHYRKDMEVLEWLQKRFTRMLDVAWIGEC